MIIDDKLNFSEHAQAISKKANKRMFFLRKLKKCKVNQDILSIFYQSSVQSVMLYNSTCFFGNANQGEKVKLERTNTLAGKIMGKEQMTLECKNEESIRRKFKKILLEWLFFLAKRNVFN